MFVQGVSPTSSFPDISVGTGLSQSSLGVPALATYVRHSADGFWNLLTNEKSATHEAQIREP
jgi:hypothetical protein